MRPGIYLRKIVSEVSTVLGLDITESAVCTFLKRIDCTHHKLATCALQRDDTLHQQFVSDVSLHKHFSLWMKQVLTGKMQLESMATASEESH